MPTRHRTPTSTYQNQNIERVSNRHLQKWKACQERRCRNVNKQERYQPPPTPPQPPPPPPTPPPQKTLACRQPNYHRKHVTKHSKNSRKCKEAQENRVKRAMKWVIRRIRKPEKNDNTPRRPQGDLTKNNYRKFTFPIELSADFRTKPFWDWWLWGTPFKCNSMMTIHDYCTCRHIAKLEQRPLWVVVSTCFNPPWTNMKAHISGKIIEIH